MGVRVKLTVHKWSARQLNWSNNWTTVIADSRLLATHQTLSKCSGGLMTSAQEWGLQGDGKVDSRTLSSRSSTSSWSHSSISIESMEMASDSDSHVTSPPAVAVGSGSLAAATKTSSGRRKGYLVPSATAARARNQSAKWASAASGTLPSLTTKK